MCGADSGGGVTWLYDGRKICYADRERPFTGKWRYGIMEKTFVIRKLIPELSADYFDFFDHLAFSDNSPMQPCYCCNFNLMEDEQNRLMEEYEKNGLEAYRVELRKAAERLVADNSLQGYLIYDGEKAVGWCNANDKSNYTAYGFNESIRGSRNVRPGYVKAVLYSETILSGQPKKRRLPPHIFSGVLSGSAERLMRQLQALPSQALLTF